MRQYPPGFIGVLQSDLARYAWFEESLGSLAAPVGTPPPRRAVGMWVSCAVNALIRQMPREAAWFCLLADDHRFEPAMVLRLLSHNVPLVAPLVCLRQPPFNPSIFAQQGSSWRGYTWQSLTGESGLISVDGAGVPGMVVRREVLDAVGDPWYENDPAARESPREDLYFCQKVRQAGYDVWVDLDLSIGHITSMSLTPRRRHDGSWHLEWWSYGEQGILGFQDFAEIASASMVMNDESGSPDVRIQHYHS